MRRDFVVCRHAVSSGKLVGKGEKVDIVSNLFPSDTECLNGSRRHSGGMEVLRLAEEIGAKCDARVVLVPTPRTFGSQRSSGGEGSLSPPVSISDGPILLRTRFRCSRVFPRNAQHKALSSSRLCSKVSL